MIAIFFQMHSSLRFLPTSFLLVLFVKDFSSAFWNKDYVVHAIPFRMCQTILSLVILKKLLFDFYCAIVTDHTVIISKGVFFSASLRFHRTAGTAGGFPIQQTNRQRIFFTGWQCFFTLFYSVGLPHKILQRIYFFKVQTSSRLTILKIIAK